MLSAPICGVCGVLWRERGTTCSPSPFLFGGFEVQHLLHLLKAAALGFVLSDVVASEDPVSTLRQENHRQRGLLPIGKHDFPGRATQTPEMSHRLFPEGQVRED